MSTNGPGFIRLRWRGGKIDILLGDGTPQVTQGYSKYEEIARPKRTTAIDYVGKDVFKMTIPCVFDGWIANRNVEQACRNLEALAVSRGGRGNPPQSFQIHGPVPHTDLDWYIESISWGDAIYSGNVRLRQLFNLSVIQKMDVPYVLNNDTKQGKFKGYKIVVAKEGDLRTTAMLTMGDPLLWRRITDLKGKKFRDWRIPRNTRVKVPRTSLT